jgi:predicted nucleotidyltransferase
MRSDLPAVALDVGVPERTLRRALQRGTVHGRRAGPRQVELADGEQAYLREHWPLVSAVTEALRTERNVRLAVIFGSVARGSAVDGSDVDVLVGLGEERPMYLAQLGARLGMALERDVDVLSLSGVREREPALLEGILRDGRPVVDREGSWPALVAEREAIQRDAREARTSRHHRAVEAVAQLTGSG